MRYRSQPVRARLAPLQATDDDRARNRPFRCALEFNEEQFSISPGQAAVFYDGEVVLGGGLIQRDSSNRTRPTSNSGSSSTSLQQA